MAKRYGEELGLGPLTKISLALPETTRRCTGRHAAFLVRKKTFAYFLNDHHGDGIVAVCAKALPGDNVALAVAQPSRFYLLAYIGPKGWVAFRSRHDRARCYALQEKYGDKRWN